MLRLEADLYAGCSFLDLYRGEARPNPHPLALTLALALTLTLTLTLTSFLEAATLSKPGCNPKQTRLQP